jgi:ferredoxin/flavodoxin---NADP+ reductase
VNILQNLEIQENKNGPLATVATSTHVILEKRDLGTNVKEVTLFAPEISEKAKAGQFVILRVDDEGERIPLTLVEWDQTEGTITLIFQEVGASTKKLATLQIGDEILNVAGPLGNPSDIRKYGLAAVICGGVGTAAAYPIAKALKEAGNTVVSIVGARNKDLLILEGEMERVSDKAFISTDDGSKGHKGFVSDVLKDLIQKEYKFDIVYAIGPPIMMRTIAEVTRPLGIKTIVSLNPIMVDGMGMCGACRVSIDGLTKFACIDGPEFDAHKTDFDGLMKRLKEYPPEERQSVDFHEHRGGGTCTCKNHK